MSNELPRSVPGTGGTVVCGVLSVLGDLRRFKNMKHLTGYVGLCPSIC
ncbi:IS110 family transposase [Marinilongibacter aquaticus]|nr:IS110 family transposase [Marinilongibacter aquaticus]